MTDKINYEWFCPAMRKVIADGLCWEYYFARRGGPVDTAQELEAWIDKTGSYKDLDEFHKVCEQCEHKHCI